MSALLSLGPAIGRGARRLSQLALNSLLPPRCLACGDTVEQPGALCAACWRGLDFLGPPLCAVCGLPFAFDMGPAAVCGACAGEKPAYDRARSVLRYDDGSRGLILGFKHADRTEGAPAYGAWLARAGAELLADTELIVPVPLHWRRLFRRRYNQSALLARALSRQTGIAWAPDALARIKPTPSQGGLGARERRLNVRGAFKVPPRRRPLVWGKRIVLIDDVLTTGATLDSAARALLRAGAAGVDALAIARVLKAD
jgi:ComF family protein